MRQVGVLCTAAYVVVRDTVGKLADDITSFLIHAYPGFPIVYNLFSLFY
jgi:hypothetical protein